MEAFNAGTLAGAGSFRCDSCGFAIALARARPSTRLPRVRRRAASAARRSSATRSGPAAPRGRGSARLARRGARRAGPRGRLPRLRGRRPRARRSRSRTAGPGSGGASRRTSASTTRRSRAGTRCSTATTTGARILDDRSLNGVFRNGDRVELAELDDGDEISVGRFRLFFVSLVGVDRRHLARQALFTRRDGPVAELALGARDVDRALLRGDPDREAGERRVPGPLQAPPQPLAAARRRVRHAGAAPTCPGSHPLGADQSRHEVAEHDRLAVGHEPDAARGPASCAAEPEPLDGVVDVRRGGQLAAAADPAEAAGADHLRDRGSRVVSPRPQTKRGRTTTVSSRRRSRRARAARPSPSTTSRARASPAAAERSRRRSRVAARP